jgi:MFS transporter, PAT family, beta-lactamase induction signal transducer AmpG
MTQAAEQPEKPSDWLSKASHVLGNRKTLIMIAFGFSAGLPFALLTGTINAWFSAAKVDLATIGVLSWIGLAYAFKFLWSPVVNVQPPYPFHLVGRRRGWILICQGVITLCILVIASQEPQTGLGVMAIAAAVGAFASATQDMSIDTWRIEVADEATPIDLLSAVYQFGYRTAAFIGGAGALFLADQLPWNAVFGVAAIVMALATLGAFAAPEPAIRELTVEESKRTGVSAPALRAYAVGAVLLAWGWAGFTLIAFMISAVTAATPPDAKAFTATYGPLIVIATVIFPCVLSAWIAHRPSRGNDVQASLPGFVSLNADRLYGVVVEPFVELMSRLKWAAVLVLLVILSYRLTDSVWGPFAYPFYLGELQYTNTEVAIASKTFGVLMLIIGIAAAAWVLLRWGRMLSMMIGAITAAVSNLLYVDLAQGSPTISAFLNVTGLTWVANSVGISDRMMWLITAIAGENIAAGFAGAVFVAYLSSLASRLHGAVQFAVFSSLTMLIGTLGRGALGEMIKTDGYASVFIFTMWLGGIAVVACALEWVRQARTGH